MGVYAATGQTAMIGSSAKSRNVAGSFKTTASIGSAKGMTKTVIGT